MLLMVVVSWRWWYHAADGGGVMAVVVRCDARGRRVNRDDRPAIAVLAVAVVAVAWWLVCDTACLLFAAVSAMVVVSHGATVRGMA